MIDMDPRGNASTGLGVAADKREHSTYQVLLAGLDIGKAVTGTLVPGMDIVPSGVELSGAEPELIHVPRRAYRVRDAMKGARGLYDFVLIDGPPAPGLLPLHRLVAADAGL